MKKQSYYEEKSDDTNIITPEITASRLTKRKKMQNRVLKICGFIFAISLTAVSLFSCKTDEKAGNPTEESTTTTTVTTVNLNPNQPGGANPNETTTTASTTAKSTTTTTVITQETTQKPEITTTTVTTAKQTQPPSNIKAPQTTQKQTTSKPTQTQPPQTQPPQIEPPQTEPPATEPPQPTGFTEADMQTLEQYARDVGFTDVEFFAQTGGWIIKIYAQDSATMMSIQLSDPAFSPMPNDRFNVDSMIDIINEHYCFSISEVKSAIDDFYAYFFTLS